MENLLGTVGAFLEREELRHAAEPLSNH